MRRALPPTAAPPFGCEMENKDRVDEEEGEVEDAGGGDEERAPRFSDAVNPGVRWDATAAAAAAADVLEAAATAAAAAMGEIGGG